MAAKYRQISLKDTFLDCQNMFIDNTPTFFQLLDEHFDLNEFIPSVISNAFCQHLRRKKTYPLTIIVRDISTYRNGSDTRQRKTSGEHIQGVCPAGIF